MLQEYLAHLPLRHVVSFLSLRDAMAVYSQMSKTFSAEARKSLEAKLFLSQFLQSYPLHILDYEWIAGHFDTCKERAQASSSSGSKSTLPPPTDEEHYFRSLLKRHVAILTNMRGKSKVYLVSTAKRFGHSSAILCAACDALRGESYVLDSSDLTFLRDTASTYAPHVDPQRYISCLALLSASYRKMSCFEPKNTQLDYAFAMACIQQFIAAIEVGDHGDPDRNSSFSKREVFLCLHGAINVCANITFRLPSSGLPYIRTVFMLTEVLEAIPLSNPTFANLLSSSIQLLLNALVTLHQNLFLFGAPKSTHIECAGDVFEWKELLQSLMHCSRYREYFSGHFHFTDADNESAYVGSICLLLSLLTHVATYFVDIKECVSREVADLLDCIDSSCIDSSCIKLARDAMNLRVIVNRQSAVKAYQSIV